MLLTKIKRNMKTLSKVEGSEKLFSLLKNECKNSIFKSDKFIDFRIFGIHAIIATDGFDDVLTVQPETITEKKKELNFLVYGKKDTKISSLIITTQNNYVCAQWIKNGKALYIYTSGGRFGFGSRNIATLVFGSKDQNGIEYNIGDQKKLLYSMLKLIYFVDKVTTEDIEAVIKKCIDFRTKYPIIAKDNNATVVEKEEVEDVVEKEEVKDDKKSHSIYDLILNNVIKEGDNHYLHLKASDSLELKLKCKFKFYEKTEEVPAEHFEMLLFNIKFNMFKPSFKREEEYHLTKEKIITLLDFISNSKAFESKWLNKDEFVHSPMYGAYDIYSKAMYESKEVMEYIGTISIYTDADDSGIENQCNSIIETINKVRLLFMDISDIDDELKLYYDKYDLDKRDM